MYAYWHSIAQYKTVLCGLLIGVWVLSSFRLSSVVIRQNIFTNSNDLENTTITTDSHNFSPHTFFDIGHTLKQQAQVATTTKINFPQAQQLKVRIVIPTSCTSKEKTLRKMQRLSWFNYVNASKEHYSLWSKMHENCRFDIKYFVGQCDADQKKDALLEETAEHHDIVKLNVVERWDLLQEKTLKMLTAAFTPTSDQEDPNSVPYHLLLKTDTDSYVNLPNLCGFMQDKLKSNFWDASTTGLYLGKLSAATAIQQTPKGAKYENKVWADRLHGKQYVPFMSGFGYFLSHKATQILASVIRAISFDDVAFNRLEDTYLGHFLSSFNVEYVNIGDVISTNPQTSVQAINELVIDHWYTDKNDLMLEKYATHKKLQRLYLQNEGNISTLNSYKPRWLI